MSDEYVPDITITAKVRLCFDVSHREYTLIMNALKKAGGNGIKLASELESFRAKQLNEISRRYSMNIHTKIEGSEE